MRGVADGSGSFREIRRRVRAYRRRGFSGSARSRVRPCRAGIRPCVQGVAGGLGSFREIRCRVRSCSRRHFFGAGRPRVRPCPAGIRPCVQDVAGGLGSFREIRCRVRACSRRAFSGPGRPRVRPCRAGIRPCMRGVAGGSGSFREIRCQQPLLVSRLPWVLPVGFGLEHGVEGDEHFAHEGGDGELGWLAAVSSADIPPGDRASPMAVRLA